MGQKLGKYNPDNVLGWSEEDFRDVICTLANIKFLTGEPLTPLMNCYYMQEGDKWKNERLEKILNKEDKMKNLYEFTKREKEIIELICEKGITSRKEIAEFTRKKENNIVSCLTNIYSKADVHSMSELMFKYFKGELKERL